MRYAMIHSISVVDSARGIGVGRALMACAEAWACEQGAVDLRLSVFDFNHRAMRLYEDLGFVARSTAMGKPLRPGAVPASEPRSTSLTQTPSELQVQGND